MKKIIISLIKFYQRIPLKCHSYCRYYPSCSNYMIISINEYGIFKGIILGIKRLLRCAPWGGYGYDPVPKKEGK